MEKFKSQMSPDEAEITKQNKFLNGILTGRGNIIASALFLVAAAFLVNWFIPNLTNNPDFISTHVVTYFYTTAILFFFMLFFSAILYDVFVGSAVFTAILFGLTFADRSKFQTRLEHVYPSDLLVIENLKSMSGMYDVEEGNRQIIIMAVFILAGALLAVLCGFFRKKIYAAKTDNERKKIQKRRWIGRGAAVIISVLALVLLTAPARGTIRIAPIDFDYVAWNQTENYKRNGFVMAFFSNLRLSGMEEPDGYSEEAITAIAEKYLEIAEETNRYRIDPAAEKIDVVYVMNESFADADRLAEYYPFSGGTAVPNLHEIAEKTPSGHIFSSRYGGGTADIEFEALTGFSMYFLKSSTPFLGTISAKETFPSAAHLFANQYGYDTIGLHPFDPAMYKRATVYPILGFQEFLGINDFAHRRHDKTSRYVSDASAYNELFDQLDKGSGNKFISLVTMQNHMPYGTQYKEHTFSTDPAAPGASKMNDDYLELLHSSDEALGDMIERVSAREKKTVVVFWGDHLPGVYDDLETLNPTMQYETPFFVYTNFGDDSDSDSDFVTANEPLGSVSSNYITTIMLDEINAKKSPFYYLMDDLKETDPTFTLTYYGENAPAETEALADYRMIEYDVFRGENYAEEMGFFDLHSD